MKKFLWVLIILAGCGKVTPEFVNHIQTYSTPTGPIWVLEPKSPLLPVTKRLVLIHGLTKDHTMFYADEPAYLVEHLWNSGWEVIMLDLPHTTDPAPYTELKALLTPDYRNYWQNRLQTILDFSDTTLGPRAKIAVGGISWGGLHTLMAAALMPQFQDYFTFIPVVDIKALSGFTDINLPNFSPDNEVGILQTKSGYMAWAGQDGAVTPQASSNFVTLMGDTSLFHHFLFPTYHHQLSLVMMETSFSFIDSL